MDKQSKHTPGPWHLCYDGQIDGHDGQTICRFGWGSFKELNEGNNASNARLIAAAPDLLAALQVVMPALEVMRKQWPRSKHDDSLDVVAFARAAIAKAEGV